MLEGGKYCRVKFNLFKILIIRAVIFNLSQRPAIAGFEAREDLLPCFFPQDRIGESFINIAIIKTLEEIINYRFRDNYFLFTKESVEGQYQFPGILITQGGSLS